MWGQSMGRRPWPLRDPIILGNTQGNGQKYILQRLQKHPNGTESRKWYPVLRQWFCHRASSLASAVIPWNQEKVQSTAKSEGIQ